MPLIYGEGRESAFARLVRKIERGSEKQKRKLKPFSTVPFTPDQEFVDRQELLSWIHDRCAQPGGRLALVGLGGIGKSQLAIQYAHNVRAASPNQFVFWVYAGTRARFEQAYRDVAEKLQLPGWDDTKTDVLKLVSDWLCDETNGNWTMVLDNVDSMDTFFSIDSDKPDSRTPVSLSTYLPQSSNGSILITSQNKDVAARLTGGYNHIREVHAMAKHESLELLRKKLRDETSAVGASELLDALGHMPLAISQAAAYINRRAHMTAERYLRELSVSNEKRERLLNWNAGDLRRDQSASSSVVAIFQLSYERIQQERPSAADLLSLMSFFNPQSIPEPVLRRYMTRNLSAENQIEANDAFEADVDLLQAYSLVEVTAKTEAYEIHALVQTCMQLWLTSVGDAMKWECAFVDLMAQEFPCGTYGSWSQCQLLLPHIERLFESRPMDDAIVLSWAQLLTNAAYYLWAHGKYPTAQQVARKAIIAQERVSGCDDEATMVAVNTLALVLKAQAKYKEAEVLQQRVLTVRNKVLGQNHPLTLDSVSNLAILLQDQGRYGEAESLFRRALSGKRIALGEQHLDTLLSMNCLAAGLQNRARYDEEQLLFKKALEGREKELGEHHPYTLMSVSNLACALMDQGKFSEAEVLNRQVLEARKMVLGVDHPDTLTSVSNLAQVLQAQEKYDEAEALNRQAFEERREQLGEQHPDTLTSAHNLGELLAERKRYKEAADCLQRAYDGLEQSLGPQHPWTVICRTTLLDVQCMAERVPRPKRSIFAYLKAQFSRNGISRVESR
ncbi:TPR-like protein [Ophiobolus disseminans]|uniref:TPR-like protein n=1 Tax=Ophiobolus disseminans TaxID=1469910 RepID=A0A6A7A4X3_9PLEO|nr:TPR-like protein [Ophiobolus disseminans]